MRTVSIRIEPGKMGVKAYINTEYRGQIYASRIKEPFGEQPFYILDGKRYELTEQDKDNLWERMGEWLKKK